MTTVVFRRPPRRTPPELPSGEIVLTSPPELPRTKSNMAQMLYMLPMLAGAGAMAFMFAGNGGGPLTYVVGGLFGVSMIGMMGMSVTRPQMGKKAELNDERRDYLRYLTQTRKQVRTAAVRQRSALFWRHPDPDALWSTAMSSRLWERRTGDEDFAYVRLGLGTQRLATRLVLPTTAPVEDLEPMAASALRRFVRTHSTAPGLPIAASLRGFSRVTIAGDRPRAAALVRAMLAQLVTLHSPGDVQVWVCVSAERRPAWEWVKWLPHAQHPTASDAAGPIRMVGGRLDEIEALVAADLAERPRFTPGIPLSGDQPHVVVVVDGGVITPDSQLASEEGVLGATLIELVAPDDPGQKDATRATLRLVIDGERLGAVAEARIEPLGIADRLSVRQAEALARLVAPYRLGSGTDEEPLSANLGLTDLLGLGDPRDIDPAVTWRPRAPRERLRLPIGVGEQGEPVDLDLKESAQEGMGPHGLIIGATGSGKSELLRTLVLGLALTHSSETLNFVLVDFKGGATFAGLAELPHTAAVITNLADDLAMVDRMRDALQGELVRRQELLRAAGNFASVRDYERARQSGADLQTLPSLLVVCDEFSELLSAKPDFIDLFVAIGRLGRSLGIHLLLASQRLEEGRLRGLDSHLSYRIGLRTFSAAESRVVLGVPDAYELPSLPGSGYLKVDTDTQIRFKAAYVSGVYATRTVQEQPTHRGELPVPFSTAYIEPWEAERAVIEATDEEAPSTPQPPVRETLLDVVVDRLAGRGPAAHQVWLPPLADSPSLDSLFPPLEVDPQRGLSPTAWPGNGRLSVPVGLIDRPFEQRRDMLWADLSGAAGHGVVVGGPQSGKSTLLRTLISSLSLSHTPGEVQFYCLDFGGGSLTAIADLPHVGGVAGRLDPARVRRMVAEVSTLLEERERRFYQLGIDGMPAYRARRASGQVTDDRYGDVFLVIDGWGTFRTEFEQLEEAVTSMAARGLSYGIHVVVTATRWAEVRAAIRDLLGTRFELRLGDPSESDVDRRAAVNVPEGAPGRGLAREKLHMLIAVPRIDGESTPSDLSQATAQMVGAVSAAWTREPAPPVRLLPATYPAGSLPPAHRDSSPEGIPIGIRESDLGPVFLDFAADPHFLCFGDVESGKSGLLRLILNGILQRYTTAEARIIVADYRRTLLDTVESEHLLGYATASTALAPMLADVRGSMQRRLPGPDVTPEQLRSRSWWSGPELFLVIDDYDMVVTQSENPVAALSDLLPQARDIGLHLILARRSGGASRSLFEPVLQRVRELGSPGIVLSASKDEGILLGTYRSAPLPAGRGMLVSRRGGDQLVQIAWLPVTGADNSVDIPAMQV